MYTAALREKALERLPCSLSYHSPSFYFTSLHLFPLTLHYITFGYCLFPPSGTVVLWGGGANLPFKDIWYCPGTVFWVLAVCWAEARDVAKHHTSHGTSLSTKNYLAPTVNGAELEKPCYIMSVLWKQTLPLLLNKYLPHEWTEWTNEWMNSASVRG